MPGTKKRKADSKRPPTDGGGETYLVRAKVLAGDDAFMLDVLTAAGAKRPAGFQFEVGSFRFLVCQNSQQYRYYTLHEVGRYSRESLNEREGEQGQVNDNYPLAAFIVETEAKVNCRAERFAVADGLLENLETLLRLFQPGYICVRRHSLWWQTNIGGWVRDDDFDYKPVEQWGMFKAQEFLSRGKLSGWTAESLLRRALPEPNWSLLHATFDVRELPAPKEKKLPRPLREWRVFDHDGAYVPVRPDTPYTEYNRPWSGPLSSSYALFVEGVGKLACFYNDHWHLVVTKPPTLDVALRRFSASYEKVSPAERLVDLITALEALCGKGKEDLTYKLALRASCLIYPAGEARERVFKEIKKLYSKRGQIVHGEKYEVAGELVEKIDLFQEYVRRGIVKTMELLNGGVELTKEEDWDKRLFFTKHVGEQRNLHSDSS